MTTDLNEPEHPGMVPHLLDAARLKALADEWEAAADRTMERAFFGDPSVAIARADALRSCASDLRAAATLEPVR